MTFMNKTSWIAKWEACRRHFSASVRVPGTKSMLKRVWKMETRLKERRACSHSKCDICSINDAKIARLVGNNTAEGALERAHLKRAQNEHEEQHLGARSVTIYHPSPGHSHTEVDQLFSAVFSGHVDDDPDTDSSMPELVLFNEADEQADEHYEHFASPSYSPTSVLVVLSVDIVD